jgi:hypothetical protein
VNKRIKATSTEIEATKKHADRLGTALGVTGAAVVAATTLFVKASVNLGATLNDQSERLGVNVEALQALRFAAEQAGLKATTLDQALARLNVAASKAASGSGQLAAIFGALGVSTSDLRRLGTEEIFEKLADGFQRLPSAADRARAAVAIFGREGSQLVGLLAQGTEAIRLQETQARSLGLVLERSAVKGLAALDDQLSVIRQQFSIAGATLVSEFLPQLRALADFAVAAAVDVSKLFAVFRDRPSLPSGGLIPPGIQRAAARISPYAAPDTSSALADLLANDKTKRGTEAAAAATRHYADALDDLAKSAAKSALDLARLGATEEQAARLSATEALVESISKIEQAEAKAVEAARGNAEKIAEAHRQSGLAIERETLRYQAQLVKIDQDAARVRIEIERQRAATLNDARLDLLPEAAQRQARAILDARSLLDERVKQLQGDPQGIATATAAFEAQVKAALDTKAAVLDLNAVLDSATGSVLASFADGIANAFGSFIDGTKSAGEAFSDFALGVIDEIAKIAIKMAVLAGIRAIGGALGITVPTAATGGIVSRPTLVLAGEGGEPEAIIPLSKSREMGFGGGAGDTHVTVNVVMGPGSPTTSTKQDGSGPSAAELGRLISAKVVETLRNEMRPGGLMGVRGRS